MSQIMSFCPTLACTILGGVLMARSHHTFCFRGGEHVVSFFLSLIVKIKPTEIWQICALTDYLQSIESPFFPFSRFWLSKHASCIMCLDLVCMKLSMPKLWPSLLWWMGGLQGWHSPGCWYPNGFMVLWRDASCTPTAATGGNHPSTKKCGPDSTQHCQGCCAWYQGQ